MDLPLPLAGVRVLDITVVYAGPYLGLLLADLGAEVIRIENIHVWQTYTRGIEARPHPANVGAGSGWPIGYPDHDPGERPWERFPWGLPLHRNKKSVTMNLRNEEGRSYFRRLAAISDVVIENNAPALLDRLGLDYASLVSENPGLVMVRMPAFGLSGGYRDVKGFGSHIESFIGHSLLRGYDDSDPSLNAEMNSGDNSTASSGLFAILAALHSRDQTGRGQLIEIAQAENSTHLFPQSVMGFSLNRHVDSTKGNHDITGFDINGVFQCAGEDRWVAISIGSDAEWQGLCRAVGDGALAYDARFASAGARRANAAAAEAIIAAWCAGKDRFALMYRLQAEGVPTGVVMDPADGLQSPQLWARGFWVRMHHPYTGTYEWPASPLGLREERASLPPPGLGEHNAYVYRDLLGLSEGEYRDLEQRQEIGTVFDEGIG